MANKQPFYHRAVVLFTATRELSREEVQAALRSPTGRFNSKSNGIIGSSIEVEECDAEAGDPADLVE